MTPQTDDMRQQLFPSYGTSVEAPAAKAPAPKAAPRVMGSTFTSAPLSLQDEETSGVFWKLVGINFLLYVVSFAITFIEVPGTLGSIIFLVCNPISYFVIAFIGSLVVGIFHHKQENDLHASSHFLFTFALLSLSAVFAIIGAIIYFILF
jgi:hypothetical protein